MAIEVLPDVSGWGRNPLFAFADSGLWLGRGLKGAGEKDVPVAVVRDAGLEAELLAVARLER